MEACVRLPVIQTESRLGGRLWHRPRGPQLTSYLKILRAGALAGLSAPAGAKKPRRGVDEGCGKA